MAHNIEFNKITNTHSFVSVKELAWHKLGKIVNKAMTSEEAMQGANLNFEVIKEQNYMEHEGVQYLSTDSFSKIERKYFIFSSKSWYSSSNFSCSRLVRRCKRISKIA